MPLPTQPYEANPGDGSSTPSVSAQHNASSRLKTATGGSLDGGDFVAAERVSLAIDYTPFPHRLDPGLPRAVRVGTFFGNFVSPSNLVGCTTMATARSAERH